ncbi:hypothetical protein HK098_006191 [Nowakowskiella sp. JEL0407]|nr:hypothetical protein HK098_006191 [Nowakowskiella sp. JEL0407]
MISSSSPRSSRPHKPLQQPPYRRINATSPSQPFRKHIITPPQQYSHYTSPKTGKISRTLIPAPGSGIPSTSIPLYIQDPISGTYYTNYHTSYIQYFQTIRTLQAQQQWNRTVTSTSISHSNSSSTIHESDSDDDVPLYYAHNQILKERRRNSMQITRSAIENQQSIYGMNFGTVTTLTAIDETLKAGVDDRTDDNGADNDANDDVSKNDEIGRVEEKIDEKNGSGDDTLTPRQQEKGKKKKFWQKLFRRSTK